MRYITTTLRWIVGLLIFGWLLKSASEYEESREKVCEDKGQVLVRPFQGKAYCTNGSREGL